MYPGLARYPALALGDVTGSGVLVDRLHGLRGVTGCSESNRGENPTASSRPAKEVGSRSCSDG
jgi:hypothetical protein